VRLPDREVDRRRRPGIGLALERRIPNRPPGGEARREVGCVAHISEA
jgi:hypothetical protein